MRSRLWRSLVVAVGMVLVLAVAGRAEAVGTARTVPVTLHGFWMAEVVAGQQRAGTVQLWAEEGQLLHFEVTPNAFWDGANCWAFQSWTVYVEDWYYTSLPNRSTDFVVPWSYYSVSVSAYYQPADWWWYPECR